MGWTEMTQKQARDWIILLLAAIGLMHEVIITEGERPWLLSVFVAMMGLPSVLKIGDGKGGPP